MTSGKIGGDFRKHCAFSGELTAEKAYWLGVLATDGCVHWIEKNQTYKISLELKESDYQLVKNFSLFIGSNEPRYDKNDKTYQTSMYSFWMGRDLIKYGITPNKSKTLIIHKSLIHNHHFWRGCLDGDGTIYWSKKNQKWRVRLYTSSYSFAEQFKQNYQHTGKILGKTFHSIEIKFHFTNFFLLQLYYESTPEIRLERKYSRAMMAIYSISPK